MDNRKKHVENYFIQACIVGIKQFVRGQRLNFFTTSFTASIFTHLFLHFT